VYSWLGQLEEAIEHVTKEILTNHAWYPRYDTEDYTSVAYATVQGPYLVLLHLLPCGLAALAEQFVFLMLHL
jgi:hypothetical protein